MMLFEWSTGLSSQDAEQILEILNAIAEREGTNGIPRPFSPEEGSRFITSLDQDIRSGQCHQLIMRRDSDQRIVAIATLEKVKIPARAHVVELKRAATHPALRHSTRHFLLRCWKFILDKCREKGWDIINIDVSEDGPHELWRRFGFELYAKIQDYARVGPRRLDGYFMHMYVDRGYEMLARYGLSGGRAQETEPRAPQPEPYSSPPPRDSL